MILAYNVNENDLKKLLIPYKIIGDEVLSMKMKELLKQDIVCKTWKFPPFLYLDGLDETSMKKVDVLQVGRVALSTPTNLEWTLEKLMKEVQEEYHYFEIRSALYDYLIHPDKSRIQSDPMYLKVLSYAFSLYENEKTPVSVLEQVLDELRKSL